MVKPAISACGAAKEGGGRLEDMSLEDVECFLIKKAMTRYDGNVSQAAKALGLSRSRPLPPPPALRTVRCCWNATARPTGAPVKPRPGSS